MAYSICIYCPDTHIQYNGRTPDTKGVGGGITARIRLATAFANLGHSVRVICNCKEASVYRGVKYEPLQRKHSISEEIGIFTTSGGALDLSNANSFEINSKIKYAWVHGIKKPNGLDGLKFDYLCCPSNFIRSEILTHWKIQPSKIFVCYNGVTKSRFSPFNFYRQRNPYSLIFSGHPSKGLDTAVQIIKLLRLIDHRFHLDVYGGNQLWGGAEFRPPKEEGVRYHGMVGQKKLADALKTTNISLNLQDVPEAFGISLAEAMMNGSIPIASPVGAFPELVQTGYNGFLVEGSYKDPAIHEKAVEIIMYLIRNPSFAEYIRRQASNIPWHWGNTAQTWEQHWNWHLNMEDEEQNRNVLFSCVACSYPLLCTADGYHCSNCGRYFSVPQNDFQNFYPNKSWDGRNA
jgi:glycosyltransferase involved in cell wall biosynthesis